MACIKKAKREYISNKINKCGNDQKLLWKTLKTMIGKYSKDKAMIKVAFDGIVYEDELETATKLNHFYVKRIEDILCNIENSKKKTMERS